MHYPEYSVIPEYYLNAFVISCRSALDYVIQDYLISHGMYTMKTGDFRNTKKRKEMLGEDKEFEKFSSSYEKRWQKMMKDPEMKYFLDKRKNIIHQGKDDNKMLQTIQENDNSKKVVTERRLEALFDEHLHPEKFNNYEKTDIIFWSAPYFKETYPNSDEFEFAIRHLDMRQFLKSFLKKCHEFTEVFYIDYKPRDTSIKTIYDDSKD